MFTNGVMNGTSKPNDRPVHNRKLRQYTTTIHNYLCLEGIVLASLEDVQHVILIVIIAGLFILFATSLAVLLKIPETPIVIP